MDLLSENTDMHVPRSDNTSAIHDSSEDDLRNPLLHQEPHTTIRQRGGRSVDLETGSVGSAGESRILDRSGAFRQSRGRWSVYRQSRNPASRNRRCRWCFQGRVWNEWNLGGWFHRLAYQRTGILMLILFVVYTSIVVVFATIYLGVSILGQTTEKNEDGSDRLIPFCHMEINNRMEALYLSLSTMASIGYGVSNYYFGECWTPLFLVLAQVCSAILFDAVAVGLLFHRISRGRKRSRTIAFSDKAVVQRVKGVPYLMFRMGELRRYHLIGATIRCYCVRHERIGVANPSGGVSVETTYFICRQMKLLHPDQSCGPDIWMGLPQVIVHRMDSESPLVPSAEWYDGNGTFHTYPESSLETDHKASLDKSNDESNATELDSIEDFLIDRDAEIVVLVEGTDEGTGASFQARHSYKVVDLAWNHTFAPCVFPYGAIGTTSSSSPWRVGHPTCSIDFSKFHDIVAAPEDTEACAYIPQ